ncbi:MAG: AAA family ATPase [Betaproteobacteria bacterium]|nr:AAA family ATPase [Betaproteobacteria bacterium]
MNAVHEPVNLANADRGKAAMSPRMVSGFGQHHSNEATAKQRKPYASIDWHGVVALVDNPQQVHKDDAQWLIPSTLASRKFLRQEAEGEYWLLWSDLDKAPPPLQQVIDDLQNEIVGGADFEVFSSRSATVAVPKARILIPLGKPLRGADWVLCQEVLNDQLEAQGIQPDRVSERTGQLCFLPNRGEHYEAASQRSGTRFDPLKSWAGEIAAKRQALADAAAALDAARKAAKARREARAAQPGGTGGGELIGAFNAAYHVADILVKAGYAQRGDTYCHPASESGSYSASVKDGRVHSLSSSDPLYTGGAGGGAHDAFSAFEVLMHGGNRDAALKDAGDNMLMIGGESWNTVRQREWIEQKQRQREQDHEAAKALAQGLLNGKATGQPLPGAGDDADGPVHRYKLLDGAAVLAQPPLKWRVRGVLPAQGLASIYGPSGSGKSFLALDLAAAVADSPTWFGYRVKPAPVVYVCLEGAAGFRLRVAAWEKFHGRALPAGVRLVLQPFKLTERQDVHDLAAAVLTVGDGAVTFLDTLNAAAPGIDENASRDMGIVLEASRELQAMTGGLVTSVHHAGKDATKGLRGHSSLNAALDAVIEVTRDGDRREWKASKVKDGADGEAHPFRLEVVQLAPDEDGEPVSSCVVRRDESAAEIQRAKVPQGGNQRLVLRRHPDTVQGWPHRQSRGATAAPVHRT